MSRWWSGAVVVGWASLLMAMPARTVRGQTPSVADLLPPTVVLYAEIPRPKELLGTVLNHPLRASLEASPTVQRILHDPQTNIVPLRAAVIVAELHLGKTWREAFESTLGGGLAIAVDAPTQGVAILAKAANIEALDSTRRAFLHMAREEAKRQGHPDPVEEREYRGIKAYKLDQSRFATFGEWLLVTNKDELGKAILDRHLDNAGPGLSSQERFRQARTLAGAAPQVWAYADLESLRDAGVAKELLGGRADNPAAELLLGGVLGILNHAPIVAATLNLDADKLQMHVISPNDPAWISPEREYYFGAGGAGTAPPLLAPAESVLSLSAYRDISSMWLHGSDLFDKETNDKLAEADSNLATLFSGRDFGEEILGAIHPQVQVVVTRQSHAEDAPRPAIKLPAFALVAQLKQPDTMQRELRRTFQSLIGFLNVVSAMNGQPQLDLGEEAVDGQKLVTATFVPEVDRPADEEAKIQFNFSPCLAFAGDRVIVSSTLGLAKNLVALTASPAGATEATPCNTQARTDFAALRAILQDNRRHLIAQNMVEKGHSREEAEVEIDSLVGLLDLVDDLGLRFSATDQMRLEIGLGLRVGATRQ